jgi:hypothetical protein
MIQERLNFMWHKFSVVRTRLYAISTTGTRMNRDNVIGTSTGLAGRGRAVAQAVSRWLPIAAARVRVWAEHVRFVVDTAEMGQVFSEYYVVHCQSSFHQILHPHNHSGQVQ